MAPKVILLCGDGTKIEMERGPCMVSGLFREMLADDDDDDISEIPVVEVSGKVMEMIKRFLEHHEKDPMGEITKPVTKETYEKQVSKWDKDFVDEIPINKENAKMYLDIPVAANYLDISGLIDLFLARLAIAVKDLDPDKICELFGKPPLTLEDEMRIRAEHPDLFKVAFNTNATTASAS